MAAHADTKSVSSETFGNLGIGNLNDSDRAALVNAILQNPADAQLTKLSLRLSGSATHMASAIVQAAEQVKPAAGLRTRLLAGACAGMALVAVFSLNQRVPRSAVQSVPVEVAMNDRFGAVGSFEGASVVNASPSDRFGGGGFEAN